MQHILELFIGHCYVTARSEFYRSSEAGAERLHSNLAQLREKCAAKPFNVRDN